MSLLEGIEQWAAKQPTWVGEALRRIWAGSITEQDKADVYGLLKKANGFEIKDAVTPAPFKVTANPAGEGAGNVARLKRIRSLSNVNRIKDGAEITFEDKGLTVIYGDNGSGKTGYGRVFKRACLARHNDGLVLPNVFKPKTGVSPAMAIFDLIDPEGNETSVQWQDSSTGGNLLPNVAVFDRECARVQVSKSNEAFFLPYGGFLFISLGEFYGELQKLVEADSGRLPQLPTSLTRLSAGGNASKFVAALTGTSTDSQIDSLAAMTPADRSRHTTLAKVVSDRKLKSPEKLAAEYRARAVRFGKLAGELDTLHSALSKEAQEKAKSNYEAASAAKEAADLASKTSFANEPVQGVGTSPWRAMFEAARKFAQEVAFPGKDFEATFDDKCVLCFQELSTEASARLKSFEAFVKDETAKNASATQEVVTQRLADLKALRKNYSEEHSELLASIQEENAAHHAAIGEFLKVCEQTLADLIDGLTGKPWQESVELAAVDAVSNWMRTRKTELEAEATAIAEQKPSPEQMKEEQELIALDDRKLLSDNLDALKKYRDGLKDARKYEDCKKALNTRAVSNEQSRLMDLVLTEELQKALDEELKFFGLASIQTKLLKQTTKGQVSHKIQLVGTAQPVEVPDVLSDGEGSVLALASYAAEIRLANSISVIVLDDPVTSLDHVWRERIAKRFAALAREKQVVVFTHDIYFMNELWDQAEEQGVQHRVRHAVGVVENNAGVLLPDETHPLETLTPERWIAKLNGHEGSSRTLLSSHGEMSYEYREHVFKGYALLRHAWERVIERYLFGDVISRYRKHVAFGRLKEVAVNVTRDDCLLVEKAMEKASAYIDAHSKAPAQRSAPPTPDDFKADVKVMADFIADMKKRQESQKKAVGAAPAGN